MNKDNLFSQIFGKVAKLNFFKPLQELINSFYVKLFKIDMSEFKPASEYKNLNELFTRELLKPREFDAADEIFISPVDGTCLSFGTTKELEAFSIKGMSYGLKELLGQGELEGEFDFANIYLSPKDYHHYHAPCDITIKKAVYIPGKLYSVAVKWLGKVDSLYTKNERVALLCEMKNGKKLWLVFVGALNVGKMRFCFDERIQTNAMANFMNMKIYTSKRASVLEISSLAQLSSYLAKKMRSSTTFLKTKSLNLLKRSVESEKYKFTANLKTWFELIK